MALIRHEYWSRGRTLQWMAGRGYYRTDGGDDSWWSIHPRYTVDICERFWEKHGTDDANGIDENARWTIIKRFIESYQLRRALIIDPLEAVRGMPRWWPRRKWLVRQFMDHYRFCASPEFTGSIFVNGPCLCETLKFQCMFWMHCDGCFDLTLVLPEISAELCFCHHAGIHLWARKRDVADSFQAACDFVIGKSVESELVLVI